MKVLSDFKNDALVFVHYLHGHWIDARLTLHWDYLCNTGLCLCTVCFCFGGAWVFCPQSRSFIFYTRLLLLGTFYWFALPSPNPCENRNHFILHNGDHNWLSTNEGGPDCFWRIYDSVLKHLKLVHQSDGSKTENRKWKIHSRAAAQRHVTEHTLSQAESVV